MSPRVAVVLAGVALALLALIVIFMALISILRVTA